MKSRMPQTDTARDRTGPDATAPPRVEPAATRADQREDTVHARRGQRPGPRSGVPARAVKRIRRARTRQSPVNPAVESRVPSTAERAAAWFRTDGHDPRCRPRLPPIPSGSGVEAQRSFPPRAQRFECGRSCRFRTTRGLRLWRDIPRMRFPAGAESGRGLPHSVADSFAENHTPSRSSGCNPKVREEQAPVPGNIFPGLANCRDQTRHGSVSGRPLHPSRDP